MKITKSKLKQLIKEELSRSEEEAPVNLPEPETLLDRLEELLKTWPACDSDPGGMACQYHKDLEEVVKEYGRPGCGPDAHGEAEGGFVGAPTAEPAALEEQ